MSGEAWEKEFLRVADYAIPLIQAVHSDEEFEWIGLPVMES
jgi:hypothetical protein